MDLATQGTAAQDKFAASIYHLSTPTAFVDIRTFVG
jgi:hypothetical protein